MIVTPAISQYIEELVPAPSDLLAELEREAERHKVPIINRASIHFICSLLRYKGDIQYILEIGTAIGYSAIWLASISAHVQVDSLEKDPLRFAQAEANVHRAGLAGQIQLHLADARDYASKLNRVYDVIFIDAAKGQYQLFFEHYAPLLKTGGIIITDNVLFRGQVVEDRLDNKRLKPLVEKIKAYNHWLKAHAQFETTFIPIGDGLALSIKR